MRTCGYVLIPVLLLAAGCGAPPAKTGETKPDPTQEAGYTDTVGQLSALNREAERQIQRGRPNEAAEAITHGLPLQARLLAAPRPTLAAVEAASDLDDLYARMLLANHRPGWARTFYEKNIARWKMWRPQTAETERRLQKAQAGVGECDRQLRERPPVQ